MINETYHIGMALYDFIPVIGFLLGGIFCVRITLLALKKNLWILMAGGALLVVLGGGLQATWKLLCAAGITPTPWMSQGQFIFMAVGYVGMLISVIELVRKTKPSKQASIGAMALWKIPFLLVMTLASLGVYGLLAILSIRKRLWMAAVGFILALLSVLAMGFLASQTQTVHMQWIEQSINTLGNWGFALGAILLHKDYKQKNNG